MSGKPRNSAARQAARARSVAARQTRKKQNKLTNDARHKANLERGGLTPWQEAKAKRFVSRAPKRLEWERRQQAA